mmetsp:Transcript_10894/g.22374  ORF Transcript_10894/g.22374 Transcript_10894/m.22374 type:complete len:143 (-) Transcript_10894:61-489(-)
MRAILAIACLAVLASPSLSTAPPREYSQPQEQHPSHPKPCGPCPEGFCSFTNCGRVERVGSGEPELPIASCGGGLCDFYSCTGGSCEGGACSFFESDLSSCAGGGCKFVSPDDTLKDGYCGGGGCTLNGVLIGRTLVGGLTV